MTDPSPVRAFRSTGTAPNSDRIDADNDRACDLPDPSTSPRPALVPSRDVADDLYTRIVESPCPDCHASSGITYNGERCGSCSGCGRVRIDVWDPPMDYLQAVLAARRAA
jgi:hypothetical protein